MISPDFSEEERLMADGYGRVVGVDEVGRGALSGPVMAAAVVLDPSFIPDGITDSKILTSHQRETLAQKIHQSADVSIASVNVEIIDQINIAAASLLAMKKAILSLRIPTDIALVDGNHIPSDLDIPALSLVRGDTRSLSIAAASIVAKVSRDNIMQELAQDYPGYGWERNVGYPTKEHVQALGRLGVTPYHRRSFNPVKTVIQSQTVKQAKSGRLGE